MVKIAKVEKSACPDNFQIFKSNFGISIKLLTQKTMLVLDKRESFSRLITRPLGQKNNDL